MNLFGIFYFHAFSYFVDAGFTFWLMICLFMLWMLELSDELCGMQELMVLDWDSLCIT